MSERYYGKLIGMKSTGSGRRQNYTYAPVSRMTNTCLAEGSDDEDEIDAAGEGVQTHFVEIVQRGGEDEALNAQQHEQAQLAQAGHERQQIAADDGGLLDGNDDAGHALDPGDILNDGGFFNLAGELQHGIERAAAGKGNVLDGARDDKQSVGIEQIEVLNGE